MGQAAQGFWAHHSQGACGGTCGHRCQALTPAGLEEGAAASVSSPNLQDSAAALLQGEGCSCWSGRVRGVPGYSPPSLFCPRGLGWPELETPRTASPP